MQSVTGKGTAQVTTGPKTKENLNLKADNRHQAQGWEWGGGEDFVVSGYTDPGAWSHLPGGREGMGRT